MASVSSFAEIDRTQPVAHERSHAEPVRLVPSSGRRQSRLQPGLGKALGPVVLALLWWSSTSFGWISEDLLPGPHALWVTFGELIASGEFGEAVSLSLYRVATGFGFGFVIGIGLALVSGLLRIGEDSLMRRCRWPAPCHGPVSCLF